MVGIYPFFRPLLFRLDPERAHAFTLSLLRLVGRLPVMGAALRLGFEGPEWPVEVFGLRFRNPIGLAAGYDKDGLAWRGLACLGFGHIEIGTVTPHPQPGNPRPRLFRLPADGALINRMGFPGRGAEFVARQIEQKGARRVILGVNIGKDKDTPLERAVDDYCALFRLFAPLADYLAVNVSSPNTVGLRRLQSYQQLSELLRRLAAERQAQSASLSRHLPILVKLAPDLDQDELEAALQAILESGMDGVIAANTTIARQGVNSPLASESGGLSGAPLRQRSTEMIRQIHTWTGGRLPIVGVGGVMSAADAREKLDAGASLVQIYTGLVYAGPGLVRRILEGL